MTFTIEEIPDKPWLHYRITDAEDNRVATCYTRENAEMVTRALNYLSSAPALWSCGHVNTGACTECYRELAARAHELATENFKLQEAANRLAERGFLLDEN